MRLIEDQKMSWKPVSIFAFKFDSFFEGTFFNMMHPDNQMSNSSDENKLSLQSIRNLDDLKIV